jgi:5-methylcytosine-specific restriction protein B
VTIIYGSDRGGGEHLSTKMIKYCHDLASDLYKGQNLVMDAELNNLWLFAKYYWSKTTVPDNTKYRFDGKEYGKGRLVLAVIKSMIMQDDLTIDALNERLASIPFNGDIVIGLSGYKDRLERSEDTKNRYFVNDLLTDKNDSAIYVSNQWGLKNIDGFVILARSVGMNIDIIADETSELMAYFALYSADLRSDWIADYRQRCDEFKAYKSSDYSDEKFLETYWRSSNNRISNVMPGGLSNSEFELLKPELPEISKKIAANPSSDTHDEVMAWAKEAKRQGKFITVKRGVINRFFCACTPQALSTVLNYGHLRNFAEVWNERGYGADVTISDNWVELNSNIVQAIKMRGLETEETFSFNTFVYRLKEYLTGELADPVRENTKPVPPMPKPPGKPKFGIDASCALNQILYGPPGTGKTYTTIEHAVKIADPNFYKTLADSSSTTIEQRSSLKARFDELLKIGQIAFTTFHQNFSYEDFVEGLKAESDGGQISYSVEDGIFKEICEKADPVLQAGGLEDAITDLKEKCSDESIKLQTQTGKVFSLSYRGGKTFRCMPEASNADRDLPANIDHVRKVTRGEIPENLYCSSYVKSIAKYLSESYSIELGGAIAQPEAIPHVLIIDEINRGNIAKIFGELITLLEPGKRKGQAEELTLTLPYSKDHFSVPVNLHVIGTMNTANTSLAKVDIALRRRFEFLEMMPKPELLEGLSVEGVDVSRLLEAINQRIELLYDRDHCIGHSYFMGLSNGASLSNLAAIFEKQVIPLLEEYFFDDWSLIHRVLGDHLKGSNQPKFIVKKYSDSDMRRLMGPDWQSDAGLNTGWMLNRDALISASAYQGIYAPVSKPDISIADEPAA